MQENANSSVASWFYEQNGTRVGGIPEQEIIELIKSGKLSRGTSIWRNGFPDWMKVENTELKVHLNESTPPPLTGEHINNTLVWVLAFAPIIGFLLENFIAGAVSGSRYRAEQAVANGHFFYVTVILNIALSYFDEQRLRKAGHDTAKFKGWIWLVPVYLYQRAKALNQNLAYFAVWIASFVVLLTV